MARMARVVIPDCPHHVTQRGVRSMQVFFNDQDRLAYLKFLKYNCESNQVSILAYCLMTNHVHLVAVLKTPQSLARAIGETHRFYTKRINERLGAKGYLFQGRFYSCPMDLSHTINSAAYIEVNPVRAGLVQKPWEYKWSSAAFHSGVINKDAVVSKQRLFWECDSWKTYISRQINISEEDKICFRTGRPLGDDDFIRMTERVAGRSLRPQQAGRKPSGYGAGK